MMQRHQDLVGHSPQDPAQVRQRQRDPEPGLGRGEWLRPASQVTQQPRREVPSRVNSRAGIQTKTAKRNSSHLSIKINFLFYLRWIEVRPRPIMTGTRLASIFMFLLSVTLRMMITRRAVPST